MSVKEPGNSKFEPFISASYKSPVNKSGKTPGRWKVFKHDVKVKLNRIKELFTRSIETDKTFNWVNNKEVVKLLNKQFSDLSTTVGTALSNKEGMTINEKKDALDKLNQIDATCSVFFRRNLNTEGLKPLRKEVANLFSRIENAPTRKVSEDLKAHVDGQRQSEPSTPVKEEGSELPTAGPSVNVPPEEVAEGAAEQEVVSPAESPIIDRKHDAQKHPLDELQLILRATENARDQDKNFAVMVKFNEMFIEASSKIDLEGENQEYRETVQSEFEELQAQAMAIFKSKVEKELEEIVEKMENTKDLSTLMQLKVDLDDILDKAELGSEGEELRQAMQARYDDALREETKKKEAEMGQKEAEIGQIRRAAGRPDAATIAAADRERAAFAERHKANAETIKASNDARLERIRAMKEAKLQQPMVKKLTSEQIEELAPVMKQIREKENLLARKLVALLETLQDAFTILNGPDKKLERALQKDPRFLLQWDDLEQLEFFDPKKGVRNGPPNHFLDLLKEGIMKSKQTGNENANAAYRSAIKEFNEAVKIEKELADLRKERGEIRSE